MKKFLTNDNLTPNQAEIAACQPQANTKDLLGETDNRQLTTAFTRKS
ncbi:hypothetical protein PQG02_06875 [Nostoc sp. UHCC 0926]|nr:hypothetical protein [Nostoc sp. UHCC 0926]WDD34064.1 hypothetical protein PQG02_06875 [Nostoc sp. UHCC 0926]